MDGRDDPDVRALVARARERDPDAWEQVYRRSYPRLFAYARRRLASDTAADDAVSEAMTRAIERIERFRRPRAEPAVLRVRRRELHGRRP